MRRRAALALALCVVWLVGFELLPWLHIARHDQLRPHIHTASGQTIYLDAGEAAPPARGHVHTHVYPRPLEHRHREASDDRAARCVGALSHGQHTLAHHGIAVPMPPPVWLAPLPVDRRPFTPANAVAAEPVLLAAIAAVARGPPLLAASC